MDNPDREALEQFLQGSTLEARRALGHLLRNKLQPLVLLCDHHLISQVRERKQVVRKLVELVDQLTPPPAR